MDELKEAIEIGEMVREKPKEHMRVLITKMLSEVDIESAEGSG